MKNIFKTNGIIFVIVSVIIYLTVYAIVRINYGPFGGMTVSMITMITFFVLTIIANWNNGKNSFRWWLNKPFKK